MGRDKADVELGGVTLLERMIRRLGPRAAGILVGTRRDGPGWLPHVTVVPDPDPGGGPLQSMCAMLRHCGTNLLVVPVDMPFLPAGLLEQLCEGAPAASAVGVAGENGAEPLPVLLRPSAIAPLEDLMRSGERRAGAWRSIAGAVVLNTETLGWTHPSPWHLMGVNTPADLALAVQRLAIFREV